MFCQDQCRSQPKTTEAGDEVKVCQNTKSDQIATLKAQLQQVQDQMADLNKVVEAKNCEIDMLQGKLEKCSAEMQCKQMDVLEAQKLKGETLRNRARTDTGEPARSPRCESEVVGSEAQKSSAAKTEVTPVPGQIDRMSKRMTKEISPSPEAPALIAVEALPEDVKEKIDNTAAGLSGLLNMKVPDFAGQMNEAVAYASLLGQSRAVSILMMVVAFCGIAFVLVAHAQHWGAKDTGHGDAAADDHHRRLGGEVSPLLKAIAFSMTSAGLVALLINLLKQPLILGYLLGGVLIGPHWGLKIVGSHEEVSEIASLGLVFLLFMIGLELDVSEILKMGKVVILTGLLQFPVCAGSMYAIFQGLSSAGLSFGGGDFAAFYVGITCGISSTMIVVKLLSEKAEAGTKPGRLTIGILIFQDIWAIIILAVQPKLDQIEVLGILKTFGMIGALIIVALAYAKYVMPAVLYSASKTVELMMVLSLSWCFFIGVTAILPFVGLSMELASLIAGVALATFPYSNEFNAKIKYIRDFFITLFFVALGMQIPTPTFDAIAKAIVVAVVVLAVRWLGIFCPVWALGGGNRLAGLATINLSQISEFALVICSLGMSYGHVDGETLTILIWTFSILAVLSSYLIGYNHLVYKGMSMGCRGIFGSKQVGKNNPNSADEHDDEERDIVLLGFHRIAAMLVAEFQHQDPELLKKIHVIDYDETLIAPLEAKGVKCSYGDFSSPDVLEHAHHGGAPNIVISTIPDFVLQGITNRKLLELSKKVWPEAHFVATADNPNNAIDLYNAGAEYVLRSSKLVAERLHDLLAEHQKQVKSDSHLQYIFDHFKTLDGHHEHRRRAQSFILT